MRGEPRGITISSAQFGSCRSPGPDPGVSTTITCTNGWLDCEGDGVPDPSCTFNGDTIGDLEQQPPSFPGLPGNGGFFITCIPPALGGLPGVIATCTAVTTDGDLDCDKTKVVDVACTGETPCFLFGFDAACEAADGTVCQVSVCTDPPAGTCDGVSAAACCTSTPAADGTDCSVA